MNTRLSYSLFVVLLGTASATAQFQPIRHEFFINAGAGHSSLLSSLHEGNNTFAIGYDFGVGYTFFFSEKWAASIGAGAAFLNGKYALPEFKEGKFEEGNPVYYDDDLGDEYSLFEYRYIARDYIEKQQVTMLTVPLMFHFETEVTRRSKFYMALGGKAGLPLFSPLNYQNDIGELEAMGKFNFSDSWMGATQPDGTPGGPNYMGFGTFAHPNNEGSIPKERLTPAYFASAEVGVKWALKGKIALYTGAYIDYGLNNILKPAENAAKVKFIEYNAARPDDYHPMGVLFASDSKLFVDKVAPLSAGVRLTLTFGIAPAKKGSKKTPKTSTNTSANTSSNMSSNTPPNTPQNMSSGEAEMPPIIEKPLPKQSTADSVEIRRRERIRDVKRLQQPVTFEFAKSDLAVDSKMALDNEIIRLKQDLDEKVRILKKYPNLKILIEGHTDDLGSQEHNLILGKERAETVKDYMIRQGIPAKIIRETVSKGKSDPLVPNTSDENRRKNRRVVIKVVTK
ncbi:ompA/motB domain-containing protein [Candidatus Symbiothrix dinenymphae]|nr:ompA/motB domain-containing protein [Candidatus Symbiothrix dinenymphae]